MNKSVNYTLCNQGLIEDVLLDKLVDAIIVLNLHDISSDYLSDKNVAQEDHIDGLKEHVCDALASGGFFPFSCDYSPCGNIVTLYCESKKYLNNIRHCIDSNQNKEEGIMATKEDTLYNIRREIQDASAIGKAIKDILLVCKKKCSTATGVYEILEYNMNKNLVTKYEKLVEERELRESLPEEENND